MLRRKSTSDAAPKAQVRPLSAHLTSLDVIRDCCARGGRFTLFAESPDGSTYTVLIDRGGPFNVSGGGLSGSEALVAAARLTSGTYTITEGWPVEQPLYQIGLDATLRMLSRDTMPAVVGDLPAPRGVDTLRNANNAQTASEPAAPPAAVVPPVSPAPVAYVAPVASVPAVAPSVPPVAVEPTPVGRMAPAATEELHETDDLAPAGPTTSADQGRAKHLQTQAILWLVQVDEPERYNVTQARALLKRALSYSMRGAFHPFRDRAAAQWQQAKDDWEKSGEVVAKQKARKAKRVREVDVDPSRGPLSGG
jgi:hypothetical protein